MKRRGIAIPNSKPSKPRPALWTPQDGPQTLAYNSEADVIGYGGEAGGGKTDLLLGLAGTKHRRSIIFRREFPRLEGIVARSREIFAQGLDHREDSFNESLHRWSLENNSRTIQLAAMQYEKDKLNFQGRPFDLHAFDEVTEFTESQFRFVTAWNRSTISGQKCQVVMTFNPPMDERQEWVAKYFAAWLDPKHPHPAKDGELRHYAMIDGIETERDNGEAFEHKGKMITPKSRTFFRAGLKDNPILESTGYGATLDALPEPLRSILKGNFDSAIQANPWQCIPTAWVKEAMARGRNKRLGTMTILGIDPARGGADKAVFAPLHGLDFAPLHKFPGVATPTGQSISEIAATLLAPNARASIDVIGIGSSGYDSMMQAELPVTPINFGAGTKAKDKSGRLSFRNIRSAAYWFFREALDPGSKSDVSLPDDSELLADLCAPNFSVVAGKILLEEKIQIKSRIGRSPDCGDAVVLAWYLSAIGVVNWSSVQGLGHVDEYKSRWT